NEPPKNEPPKNEPPKNEPPKNEPPKNEPPKNEPSNNSRDPPIDSQSDPPSPSSTLKEPSTGPAAAAPQPQQPSPNPPVVKPLGDDIDGFSHDITVRPATQGDKSGPKPPSGDQAKQPPSGPDPLKSISAVLFPSPSPNQNSGKQGSGSGSEGQVSNGQGQQSWPNDQSGSSGRDGEEKSTSGQIQSDSQNKASSPGSDPSTVNAQDQAPTPKDRLNSNDHATLQDGDLGTSDSNQQPQPEGFGKGDGSETSPGTDNGGPKSSSNDEKASNGNSSPPAENPQTDIDSGPAAFAFVSNTPPLVAGSHTIARAPDGAAVVGTATIRQGEAQVVDGIPVSVAPSAIVVGSSTFAVTPPERVETPNRASAISQAPGGGLVVGSRTIMPGQQDSINGHEVSVGASQVVVDGNSIAFPAMTPPPSVQPIDIGGMQVSQGLGNNVVIGDSTYKPGAHATVSGHAVSVGSGEVEIDGTTHRLPSTPAGSALLVDGQSVFRASNGHVIIGTASLTPGSETTIGGHAISVATNSVVLDQSTYALPSIPGVVVKAPTLPDTPSMAPLTVGEHTISKAANGALIIGTSTLPPGNQVTIAGHTVSAAANRIIVDDSTYSLPNAAGAVQTPAVKPITLENGIVVTPGANAITVSEQIISVFPNGKSLVVGGSTIAIPTATTSAQSVFTVAGQVFTAAPTGFAIAGSTVSPGGAAVTVSGTVVSLGPGGVQVGSETFALPTTASASASTVGMGDVIMSGFGQGDGGPTAGSVGVPAPTAGGVEGFVSGSSRRAGMRKEMVLGVGLGVLVFFM
ncbi:MAG: hypothetical protein Q9184_006807, partial [Pyrenodesmia sp. 2 TL-2023]